MHASTATQTPGNRLSGVMAIISGVFGIGAFACLMLFLLARASEGDPRISQFLLGSHDAGVIVQSLCLIPFSLALDAMARRQAPASIRMVGSAAATFLALIVVLMSLSFVKVVADVLYMIPQGAVGGWLIVACRQAPNGFPRGLRRLGTVAGAGLMLISVFPIGYAVFVDPAILHGPVSDDDPGPPGTDRANGIVHIALAVGTLIGGSTYPIWSALAGRWLLRRADS